MYFFKISYNNDGYDYDGKIFWENYLEVMTHVITIVTIYFHRRLFA